jgi:hypothetical protein
MVIISYKIENISPKIRNRQNLIFFGWKFHTWKVHTSKKRDRFKIDVQYNLWKNTTCHFCIIFLVPETKYHDSQKVICDTKNYLTWKKNSSWWKQFWHDTVVFWDATPCDLEQTHQISTVKPDGDSRFVSSFNTSVPNYTTSRLVSSSA